METKHSNFFTFTANDNFELGVLMGEKFGEFARNTLSTKFKEKDWPIWRERAKKYLDITEKYFPSYVEEMRGYAQSAKIDFLDLWTLSLEDEVTAESADRCTTIVSNEGKLVSHNEDWDKNSANNICLCLKKIGDTTILELYYLNTLGGNAISINSHGFIISINSLTHADRTFGIPRNVIARSISETINPENDFKKLQSLPRGLGLNFNIVNKEGKVWNIECSSRDATLAEAGAPYVHTNHYLGKLKSLEKNDNWDGTFDRYEVAQSKIKKEMTVSEMIDLSNDQSRGSKVSIMNERTIAKMIVDLENSTAKVWMKREEGLGWVNYELDKMLGWE